MIPTYELLLKENTHGVSLISVVDFPAIEENYFLFDTHKIEWKKNVRGIISGPVLIPNKMIYRNDENGEYNTFLSASTIEQVAMLFMQNQNQNNVNLLHDKPTDKVFVFESFISDVSRGVMPMQGYGHLPNGTWFVSMKVEDARILAQIETGELQGFSIEGLFGMEKKQISADVALAQIRALFN